MPTLSFSFCTQSDLCSERENENFAILLLGMKKVGRVQIVGLVALALLLASTVVIYRHSKHKNAPSKTSAARTISYKSYTDNEDDLRIMSPADRAEQRLQKAANQTTSKDYDGAVKTLKLIEGEGIPAGYEVGVYSDFIRAYAGKGDVANKAAYQAKLKAALVASGALGANDPLPDVNGGKMQ